MTYAAELKAATRRLGPGEKTTSPEILPLGRRRPGVDFAAPTGLSSLLLAAVTNAHPELASLAFALAVETGTATPRTSPSVPLTTADPPNVLVLKYLAFRA